MQTKYKVSSLLLRFLLLYLLFFSISYFSITFYRQYQFEKESNQLIEDITKGLKEFEESYMDRVPSSFKMTEEMDRRIRDSWLFTLWWMNYGKESIEIPLKDNYEELVIFRLFEIYAKYYSQVNLYRVVNLVRFDYPDFFKNFGDPNNIIEEKISEWEEAGGKREEDWWNSFQASKFYKTFIDEIFNEIENPKGFNVDNLHLEIENYKFDDEPSFLLKFFFKRIVKNEKDMAKHAMEDFEQSKLEEDYSSAYLESSTIFNIWNEQSQRNMNLNYLEKLRKFPWDWMPNIYHDLMIIIIFPLIVSLVVVRYVKIQ